MAAALESVRTVCFIVAVSASALERSSIRWTEAEAEKRRRKEASRFPRRANGTAQRRLVTLQRLSRAHKNELSGKRAIYRACFSLLHSAGQRLSRRRSIFIWLHVEHSPRCQCADGQQQPFSRSLSTEDFAPFSGVNMLAREAADMPVRLTFSLIRSSRAIDCVKPNVQDFRKNRCSALEPLLDWR